MFSDPLFGTIPASLLFTSMDLDQQLHYGAILLWIISHIEAHTSRKEPSELFTHQSFVVSDLRPVHYCMFWMCRCFIAESCSYNRPWTLDFVLPEEFCHQRKNIVWGFTISHKLISVKAECEFKRFLLAESFQAVSVWSMLLFFTINLLWSKSVSADVSSSPAHHECVRNDTFN